MAEFVGNAVQTVAPGESIVFSENQNLFLSRPLSEEAPQNETMSIVATVSRLFLCQGIADRTESFGKQKLC